MGTTRCDCPPLKGSADLSSGFAHAKTVAAQQSTLLLVSAIVALAINLRLSVNALGAALPTVRAELGLDGAAAGLLTASPPIVFAVAGIATPALAARLGTARTIALALVIATAGQLVRLLGSGVESLFAGTLLALAGLAVGNVLLPGVIKEHFPDRVAAYSAVYVTTLSVGAAIGSGLTIPTQQVLGGSWRTGFAVWAAVAVLAVLPWVMVAVRSPRSAPADRRPPGSVRALLSSGLAWAWRVSSRSRPPTCTSPSAGSGSCCRTRASPQSAWDSCWRSRRRWESGSRSSSRSCCASSAGSGR